MLVANNKSVLLTGEWLEAFWCPECELVTWYHIRKLDNRRYEVLDIPHDLWQKAVGVINPDGNTSVSEFTKRQARMVKFGGVKDFRYMS